MPPNPILTSSRNRIAVSLLLLSLTMDCATGQHTHVAILAIDSLQKSIANLIATHRAEDILETLKSVRADVSLLQDHFLGNQIPIPGPYGTMLNEDAELMTFATKTRDREQLRNDLMDAAADLNLKANFIRQQRVLGAVPLPSTFVKVIFTTKKDSHPTNGYLIRCNHRRFDNEANPTFVFNDPTSPTQGELPPGVYKCFFMREDSIVWRQQFSIGMSGRESEPINVEVP